MVPLQEVNVQLVDVLIACHDEALRRVDVLATGEAQLAACVKALFHGLVSERACEVMRRCLALMW